MTSSHAMRRRVLGLLLAPLLLLAACSSGPVDTNAVESDQLVASLLNERFTSTEYEANVANEVELCMKHRGFDYEPPPTESASAETALTQSLWLGDPDAFDPSVGFGIVDGEEQALLELVATAAGADTSPAILTEETSAAYQHALWGDGEDKGCEVEASEAVQRLTDNTVPTELIRDFAQAAAESPELAAIELEWSSCMLKSGYDFASEEEAQAFVSAGFHQAAQPIYAQLDELVGANAALAGRSTSTADINVPIGHFDDVRAIESRVAVATFDCVQPLTERLGATLEDVAGSVLFGA